MKVVLKINFNLSSDFLKDDNFGNEELWKKNMCWTSHGIYAASYMIITKNGAYARLYCKEKNYQKKSVRCSIMY